MSTADTPDSTGRRFPVIDIAAALKSKVVAGTGVLLAVAAMVNAAVDVAVAIRKLPRSDAEQQNIELFKKYFGKPPLVLNALPIRSPAGVVEVRFEIFEEGDIHVEYGKNSQWFPLPKPEERTLFGLLGIIPSAQAQTLHPSGSPGVSPAHPEVALRYSERLEGSKLIRMQELQSGRVERTEYDIRSGRILNRDLTGLDALRGDAAKAPPKTTLKELMLEMGGR